jgi:hypothetical protein
MILLITIVSVRLANLYELQSHNLVSINENLEVNATEIIRVY